ncbi:YppG family protein [Pontibacillus salicampi]|uniref:YppG family protein n=1 Tax=Pontibacillus salicampi TaxID=1449801 RepID=A0ABV6LMS5_9BACI
MLPRSHPSYCRRRPIPVRAYGPLPEPMPYQMAHQAQPYYMPQQGFPMINQSGTPPVEEAYHPPAFQTPYEQFQKPPQPTQWNPYVSAQQNMPPLQQQQQKGIMQYFMDKNGQLDLDKMLNTMGQVANTANQFSPLVKGIGSFMKGIG